ncbi:EpsG family protein [uncultured Mesonia sp.]|uniref:EpsG family protein n=1 Tax=uncultured Mesonia sp. TaxID=399731 RepID=UPI00374E55E2
MFDFIPIQQYTPLYYHLMFVNVLLVLLHLFSFGYNNRRNIIFLKYFGIFNLMFVLLYMGLRPNHAVFVDMRGYGFNFTKYQHGNFVRLEKGSDYLFELFTLICSQITNLTGYFFICTLIYVYPLYKLSKKWFGNYWFYAFLMLIVSFSFWSYGTNGIRNGLASAIFIFALTRNKFWHQILFLIIAIGFHKSMLLPTFGYLFAYSKITSRKLLYFWVLCIPLSLVGGNFFENLFANLGFDERLSYLTDDRFDQLFSSSGFRWDFLFYSAIPVIVGWYFLIRKKWQNQQFEKLYKTYLVANGVWILIIEASFSNRFAYLSWFLMGVIVIYPILKYSMDNAVRSKLIAHIILLYFLFTYTLNVIL